MKLTDKIYDHIKEYNLIDRTKEILRDELLALERSFIYYSFLIYYRGCPFLLIRNVIFKIIYKNEI